MNKKIMASALAFTLMMGQSTGIASASEIKNEVMKGIETKTSEKAVEENSSSTSGEVTEGGNQVEPNPTPDPSPNPDGGNEGANPDGGDGSTNPDGGDGSTNPDGGDGSTNPDGGDGSTNPDGGDGGTNPDGGDGGTNPDGGDGGTNPDGGDGGTNPDGGDGGTNPDGGDGSTNPDVEQDTTPVVTIEDNNLKNALLSLADKNSNGELTEKEMESITGELDLSSKHISSIKGLAKAKNVTSLNLLYNDLTSINKSDFEGMSKLQSINLALNEIRNIPESVFSGLPLTSIDLSSNGITSLNKKTFEGLNKIVNITLDNNKINSISNVFSGLSTLEDIGMAENKITSVSKEDFAGLRNLKRLDLSLNDIENISSDMFKDSPSLVQLDITNNKVRTVKSFGESEYGVWAWGQRISGEIGYKANNEKFVYSLENEEFERLGVEDFDGDTPDKLNGKYVGFIADDNYGIEGVQIQEDEQTVTMDLKGSKSVEVYWDPSGTITNDGTVLPPAEEGTKEFSIYVVKDIKPINDLVPNLEKYINKTSDELLATESKEVLEVLKKVDALDDKTFDLVRNLYPEIEEIDALEDRAEAQYILKYVDITTIKDLDKLDDVIEDIKDFTYEQKLELKEEINKALDYVSNFLKDELDDLDIDTIKISDKDKVQALEDGALEFKKLLTLIDTHKDTVKPVARGYSVRNVKIVEDTIYNKASTLYAKANTVNDKVDAQIAIRDLINSMDSVSIKDKDKINQLLLAINGLSKEQQAELQSQIAKLQGFKEDIVKLEASIQKPGGGSTSGGSSTSGDNVSTLDAKLPKTGVAAGGLLFPVGGGSLLLGCYLMLKNKRRK